MTSLIGKTEYGVRLLKSSDGTLIFEMDSDVAWWLAFALKKSEPNDYVTDAVMDFVCDHFGEDITAGEFERRTRESSTENNLG